MNFYLIKIDPILLMNHGHRFKTKISAKNVQNDELLNMLLYAQPVAFNIK